MFGKPGSEMFVIQSNESKYLLNKMFALCLLKILKTSKQPQHRMLFFTICAQFNNQ